MSEVRLIEETVARCVSLMVFYLGSGRSPQAKCVMVEEVQSIARWASALGMSRQVALEQIVRPVRAELIVRYGSEAGGRLFNEFFRVYDGMNKPIPLARPVLA